MAIDIEAPGANETALVAALRALVERPFSGALVKKSADQTTANYSAGAVIAWDAETRDVGGWHDNVTNNDRLTVPSGSGITHVRCHVNMRVGALTVGTRFYVRVDLDGASGSYSTEHSVSYIGSADTETAFSTPEIPVTAGTSYFNVSFVCTDTSITVKAASTFAIEATRYA